jgi:hypothetical protein
MVLDTRGVRGKAAGKDFTSVPTLPTTAERIAGVQLMLIIRGVQSSTEK